MYKYKSGKYTRTSTICYLYCNIFTQLMSQYTTYKLSQLEPILVQMTITLLAMQKN